MLEPNAPPSSHKLTLVLPSSLTLRLARSPATAEPLYGVVHHDPDRTVVHLHSSGSETARVGTLLPASTEADRSQHDLCLVAGQPPLAFARGEPVEVIVVDEARYRDRLLALPEADAVNLGTVAIVGLGSVGSDLAARLVRVGVPVVGFDPDTLDVENLVRWGLTVGLDQIGRTKAAVLAEALTSAVPRARIAAHAIDVVRDATRFEKLMRDAKPILIIAATDTRDSRRTVNAAAADHGVPALFVALSDGAASVRIEVVQDARQGPCHLCSSHNEAAEVPDARGRGSNLPYAADRAPTTGVPALPMDVAIGSALAARVALALAAGRDWRPYFQRGLQEGNVQFVSLRPDWWVFEDPWERLVYPAERNEDCACCGAEERAAS